MFSPGMAATRPIAFKILHGMTYMDWRVGLFMVAGCLII
jgi:hypothetical protein